MHVQLHFCVYYLTTETDCKRCKANAMQHLASLPTRKGSCNSSQSKTRPNVTDLFALDQVWLLQNELG